MLAEVPNVLEDSLLCSKSHFIRYLEVFRWLALEFLFMEIVHFRQALADYWWFRRWKPDLQLYNFDINLIQLVWE